jgi:hypothetical protein
MRLICCRKCFFSGVACGGRVIDRAGKSTDLCETYLFSVRIDLWVGLNSAEYQGILEDPWLASRDRMRVLGELLRQCSRHRLLLDLLHSSENEVNQRQPYRSADITQADLAEARRRVELSGFHGSSIGLLLRQVCEKARKRWIRPRGALAPFSYALGALMDWLEEAGMDVSPYLLGMPALLLMAGQCCLS